MVRSNASASPAFLSVMTTGIVNLFDDITHEGGASTNGPFMASLGASAAIVSITAVLGKILGYALRLPAGYAADRTGRYWLITFVGYVINLFAVPAMALAGSWQFAAALVLAERIGRALRKPTVEAMLSYTTGELGKGWVYALNTGRDRSDRRSTSYAVEAGIIETNPAHGIRKPKDKVRNRCLTEADHRSLGGILRKASEDERYQMTTDIIRQIALTGCRRSEMIKLRWIEADMEVSCLRLVDSKEGASSRAIGLPVVEYVESRRTAKADTYVFPGQGDDNAFGSFPNHWAKIFRDTSLGDITPHVLRHSFASIANDLGFTEVTIAALVGHAKRSVTSKYIHTLDTALIMAADTISGYIQGHLDGIEFKQTAYAVDRDSREAALARFLKRASGGDQEATEEERRLAA
jgi:integrase